MKHVCFHPLKGLFDQALRSPPSTRIIQSSSYSAAEALPQTTAGVCSSRPPLYRGMCGTRPTEAVAGMSRPGHPVTFPSVNTIHKYFITTTKAKVPVYSLRGLLCAVVLNEPCPCLQARLHQRSDWERANVSCTMPPTTTLTPPTPASRFPAESGSKMLWWRIMRCI